MVNLAIKDLFHKKGKFCLIIIGLCLCIFFIQYSAAMFNGVLEESTKIIDKNDFEVWIKDEDCTNIMDGGIVDDSVFEKIKKMEKVDSVERLIIDANSRIENEEYAMQTSLIGADIHDEDHDAEPWDVVEGDAEDLMEQNTIIVDKSLEEYMGDLIVNDRLTIGGVSMRIVGFCEGNKFMFNPFVWASLQTVRNIAPWLGNWSTTFGIKLDKGYSIEEFKEDFADDIDKNMEVLSSEELKENTHDMIVNEGGLGGAIYIMVGMGFFVGFIILLVTLVQSIQEKIPEFAVLKALGASKGFLNKMTIFQVFVYITLSFIIGTGLVALNTDSGGMPIIIHIPTTFILYISFLLLGFICALVAMRKVHKLDPAIVFK